MAWCGQPAFLGTNFAWLFSMASIRFRSTASWTNSSWNVAKADRIFCRKILPSLDYSFLLNETGLKEEGLRGGRCRYRTRQSGKARPAGKSPADLRPGGLGPDRWFWRAVSG